MKIYAVLAIMMTVFALSASASNQMLPQEKIEATQEQENACMDKEQGDACEFTNSNGDSLNGTCTMDPPSDPDAQLMCIPLH